MKLNHNLNGSIQVEGIDGYFSQTCANTFCKIYHCLRKETGYGLEKRELVGNIPQGVYGGGGIKAKGNVRFGEMVESAITRYVEAGRAA